MSPLFLESALEREVSIMQTEEDDATTKIENRINRIQEHMADPSHPFSRPETGGNFNFGFLMFSFYNLRRTYFNAKEIDREPTNFVGPSKEYGNERHIRNEEIFRPILLSEYYETGCNGAAISR